MAKVTINDVEIELAEGERLNGIEAAKRAGVEIPHYCWHPGLSVVANCRMCMVEAGTKDPETGDVRMIPKLVPACQTPAGDNSVFITESEKVLNARAMVEEDLLLHHPIDCPVCDKAGECHLQDYHAEHGREERRADIEPFHSRRRPMGETVTLFVDRCISCTRCVRFTREITGTAELMLVARGSKQEIDVFPGFPLDNKLAGNVVDLCPVGALGDTNFLYSQRVWFMKSHDNVCTGCSTGCSITVEENQDRVYRVRPRENEHINQWWMCDEGRYGWEHVHAESRLVGPKRFDAKTESHVDADWTRLPQELDEALRASAKDGRLAAVLSPHLTVEEAYLLAQYVRAIDPEARIAPGVVPVADEDESFPNGFTIRAEKCPNRRGVEEVADHFMGKPYSWENFLSEVESGEIAAAWITGGYKKEWIDEAEAERVASLQLLVVQDMFESPLMSRAHYQLPAASFAEREGSYVNCADRLQSVAWAIRPPAGVQLEGKLFWRLAGREGMYNAKTVLDEIAADVTYFDVAKGSIPSTGIDLKCTQIAEAEVTVS